MFSFFILDFGKFFHINFRLGIVNNICTFSNLVWMLTVPFLVLVAVQLHYGKHIRLLPQLHVPY